MNSMHSIAKLTNYVWRTGPISQSAHWIGPNGQQPGHPGVRPNSARTRWPLSQPRTPTCRTCTNNDFIR